MEMTSKYAEREAHHVIAWNAPEEVIHDGRPLLYNVALGQCARV
jgi:hypothetical protein